MRKSCALLAVLVLVAATASVQGATPRSDEFLKAIQVTPGTPLDDGPVQSGFDKARADTIWYGGHDGGGYAVEGGIWDFEDGSGGPDWQGWYGVDQTANDFTVFYRVDANDFDCPSAAPIILAGTGNVGQLWCGAHGYILDPQNQPRAVSGDGGCWVCDAGGNCTDPATRVGYGNNWCQQADSPSFLYNEVTMEDVAVEFQYFLDNEGFTFDFVRVQVIPIIGTADQEPVGIANIDDGSGGIIGSPTLPATFVGFADASNFPSGIDSVKLRFEYTSDGGWSDEDAGGGVCSTYGPFGADNVSIVIAGGGSDLYTFETDDEGWDFEPCDGNGNFVDLHPLEDYNILDPCACELEGWIMAYHDDNFEHPGDPDGSGTGQANMAVSPIIDRTAHPAPDFNDIFTTLNMYAWLPLNNGVLYRPGALYYEWVCTESEVAGWSPRTGQAVWFYVGTDPVCFTSPNNLTVDGVPANADLYRVVWELLSCCACFGIGDDCTNITNETPLIDNIRFGLSGVPNAPVISLDTWRLQDAFPEDGKLSATSTGRCDDPDVPAGSVAPMVLADSLGIAGPVVGGETSPWEAHFWFRVGRKGAGQDAVGAYGTWLSDHPGDPEADFVKVKMDSSQLGANAFANKFCTFAHPDDSYYQGDPEADERSDLNEIIRDDVIAPGTKIQYFITANFVGESTLFFLPDTSGQNFFDYEVLPSMRLDVAAQATVWPCVLYWDAYNRGAENFIQPSLDAFLPDVPGEGPNNDRYDMWGASSNFSGSSIYRLGVGANNGATLAQLLSYRTIILNTGDFSAGAMDEPDIIGAEDWLLTTICGSAQVRQGFIANGDEVAGIIEALRPSFLTGTLGAGLECSPYRDSGCPSESVSDSSYCVEIVNAGGPYDHNSDDVDDTYYAFGNGCPNVYTYSVLFTTDGVGNRLWKDYDAGPFVPKPDGKGLVEFAQVVNDQSGGLTNYRSIIDGYSYHHITETFDSELGDWGECVPDEDGRIQAAGKEVIAALKWIFDADAPDQLPEFCIDPCTDPSDAPDIGTQTEVSVNRLFQNQPNPFNPRTAVRFSVAARGPVQLAIYDVSGRLVKTLVDKPMDAGLHSVVWDGTDNKNHKVTSGIYWSQLKVGDYFSNKKMVLLK
jgi:hypothetical protein